ncbi:MAG: AAA family ATPase [Pirellulaceae bacterium]
MLGTMDDHVTIHVPVQIENFGEQFMSARPLGPWRLQAVGRSWPEVQSKLLKRLTAAIPKTLPSHYFEGDLPPKFDQWEAVVDLPPQTRSATWEEPVLVRLQCFRWHVRSGQCFIRVPAVNCTLFGKCEELLPEEVTRQARTALVRLAENKDLLALRERFESRRYDFASIELSVPFGAEPAKQDETKKAKRKTATLRESASDLTTARLDPIFGLDDRVHDLADYFLGETPQSVLIVGPSGVGKSALVHRLVKLRKQLGLADRKIWSTSGSRIVSGMSGLGMWQQRCSKLIRQAHETHAIIHLGSLFELLEAGKIDGQPGVASMVRQAIARGRLLAIAECTPEQMALIEREDPMLLRAFARFEMQEPPSAKIKAILRAAAQDKLASSQVDFSDQAIEELCRLHGRFATYSAMPATPLRLMQSIREDSTPGVVVEASDVARAFAKQTGLPEFLVNDAIPLDLDAIRRQLVGHIIGQAEPVQLIVNLIATMKARMVRPGRPLATLMFIGPTGVGKTEMAKAIAKLLYSDTRRMIRIDMSEYSSPWSIAKLIGKPGEGDGTLTSPIREQPFSVVLLDEFEKADPNVFDMLLQLLGEGRLTDARGRLADFRNAVVVMTSNLGADSYREGNFGFGDSETGSWREHFEREVRRFVRPEFLGRLDRIVPFQPLPKDSVRHIALRELELLKQRAGLKYSDSQLEFTPAAIDFLCDVGYQPKYGARPLRRAIEEHITVPLADALSELSNSSTWNFLVEQVNQKLVIRAEKRSSKTKSTKQIETQVINAWQELGIMARTAIKCAPLRDLENETERNVRRNLVTSRKLAAADGPSRIAVLKEQLQLGKQQVITARRLIKNLYDVAEQINQQQLELMLRWHRNQPIDWNECTALQTLQTSNLRQATENVIRGQLNEGTMQTIIVAGKGHTQLRILWDAYHELSQQNEWRMDSYLLTAYDPLLDPESPEFRRRVSEKRIAANSEITQPNMYLLTEPNEEEALTRVADAFRHDDSQAPDFSAASTIGFAIQVFGAGVSSWLGDEYGVFHFIDTTETGSSRRQRFRVDVSTGRLSSQLLPHNWPEPIAQPDRDPRRMILLGTRTINGLHGLSVNYAQGKLVEGLVEIMKQEHEQALWRAIGYRGVPAEAQLRNVSDLEFEVPF